MAFLLREGWKVCVREREIVEEETKKKGEKNMQMFIVTLKFMKALLTFAECF